MADIFTFLGRDIPRVEGYPRWIVWVVNPAVVTMCSYLVSVNLQTWFESWTPALNTVNPLTLRSVVANACVGFVAAIKRAKNYFKGEPWFYAALGLWLVQGLYSWGCIFSSAVQVHLFFDCFLGNSEPFSTCVVYIKDTTIFVCTMLVVGIVLKVVPVCWSRTTHIAALQEPRRVSGGNTTSITSGSCAQGSRLPSLLIGWCLGFWVTLLLWLLSMTWNPGWWYNAPTIVTVLAYVIIPSFAIVGVFMMADTNVLGTNVEAYIKPAVDVLTDRRRILFWVMAVVFRDAFFVWVKFDVSKVILFYS